MRAFLAAIALQALATGASAQAYRCTDAAGGTTYQSAPCNGPLVVPAPASAPTVLDPGLADRRRLAALTEAACVKRGAPREPVIGMSEADLSCIPQYRIASAVNETRTAAGRRVQYVFPRALLYFSEGRLTAIQAVSRP